MVLVKGAKQTRVVPDDVSAGWKNFSRHLGIMFWGAYFRVVYDETKGFRESIRRNRNAWILVALTVLIVVIGGSRQFRFFIHPSRSWFSPYVVAPLLFWIWVAWLRVRTRAMAWLGQISYSIYLFHLVVATPLVCWVALEGNTALPRVADSLLLDPNASAYDSGQRGGLLCSRAAGHRFRETTGWGPCD